MPADIKHLDRISSALGSDSRQTSITPMEATPTPWAETYLVKAQNKTGVLRLVKDVCGKAAEFAIETRLNDYSAKIGIGPRLLMVDYQSGNMLLEFIDSPHLHHPTDAFLSALADSLAKLHSEEVLNQFFGIDLFSYKFEQIMKLTTSWSHEADISYFKESLEAYHTIVETLTHYPVEMVFLHNDLNFTNILYDGTHVYFIDWDHARTGDFHQDLAIAINTFQLSGGQLEFFLAHYSLESGRSVSDEKLRLYRELSYLRYGLVTLGLSVPHLDHDRIHHHLTSDMTDFKFDASDLPLTERIYMLSLSFLQTAKAYGE